MSFFQTDSLFNCVTATDDCFTAHQPDATQISTTSLPCHKVSSCVDESPVTSCESLSEVVVMLHGRVLERPPLPPSNPYSNNRSAIPVRVPHDPIRRRRSESPSPVRWRSQSLPPSLLIRPGHLVENFDELADEHRRLNLTRRPLFDGDNRRTMITPARFGLARLLRVRRNDVPIARRRPQNNVLLADDMTQRDDVIQLPAPPTAPPLMTRLGNHPVSLPFAIEEHLSFTHPFGQRPILNPRRNQRVAFREPASSIIDNSDTNNNRSNTDNANTDAAEDARTTNGNCNIS